MNIAQESADLNVWRDQATGAQKLASAIQDRIQELRRPIEEQVKAEMEAKEKLRNAAYDLKEAAEKTQEASKKAVEAEMERSRIESETWESRLEEGQIQARNGQAQRIDLAYGQLSEFKRERALEDFKSQIEDMSPADLMHLKDSLTGQKAIAAANVESLLGAATQSGSTKDIEAAKWAAYDYDFVSRKLNDVESLLAGMATPSIQEQMRALGSDAMKGYDTAGYGSLERDMYNVEKETKDNTKSAADSLSSIKSNINEIKTMMTQNSNKSVWG